MFWTCIDIPSFGFSTFFFRRVRVLDTAREIVPMYFYTFRHGVTAGRCLSEGKLTEIMKVFLLAFLTGSLYGKTLKCPWWCTLDAQRSMLHAVAYLHEASRPCYQCHHPWLFSWPVCSSEMTPNLPISNQHLFHPHKLQHNPTPNRLHHFPIPNLRIPLPPIERHAAQSSTHLRPPKPRPSRRVFTRLQHHTPYSLPHPLRVHKKCSNLRSVLLRIKSIIITGIVLISSI